MMPHILILLLFLTACGGFKTQQPQRSVASASEGLESESRDLENKLNQIHSYSMIAQRELYIFDGSIKSADLSDIYQSPAYLKLQASHSLIDELENEIVSVLGHGGKEQTKKDMIIKINQFSKQSRYHFLSMDNLLSRLNPKGQYAQEAEITQDELEQELKRFNEDKAFHVFEQNIEHLAYMMESSTINNQRKFKPSSTSKGNISGDEFPAKVWSLTFDDGPTKVVSTKLLEELNRHSLKATFFQLAKNVLGDKEIARSIHKSGNEIATHSFSHQQLTRLGALEMEKEITGAVKKMGEVVAANIQLYRLPYGAGMDNHVIREKIAENGLIHVHWNIDSLDWISQSPERIVQRTKKLMKKTKRDAGIIVFHDTHPRTLHSAPIIMDFLMQENRRVCTIGEVIKQMNMGSQSVCQSK